MVFASMSSRQSAARSVEMQRQTNPRQVALSVRGVDLPAVLFFSGLYVIVALPAIWMPARLDHSVIWSGLLLGVALVMLSVIDVKTYRLPDILTMSLLATGLGCCFLLEWDDVRWRMAAAAAAFGALGGIAWLYLYLRGRHGLGLGDAKLFAASGAWVGIDGLPMTLLAASLGALAVALGAALSGHRLAADTRVPFGPFLAGGTWLVWLYGSWL